MADYDEAQWHRREAAQNYCAGYYWGNYHYESYDLAGRRSESELKKNMFELLKASGGGLQLDPMLYISSSWRSHC